MTDLSLNHATEARATIAKAAGVLKRIGIWVGRRCAGSPQAPVNADATACEFDRLDDHLLRDVGVGRKPRPTKWHPIARGMKPVPIVEYDYFHLDK